MSPASSEGPHLGSCMLREHMKGPGALKACSGLEAQTAHLQRQKALSISPTA